MTGPWLQTSFGSAALLSVKATRHLSFPRSCPFISFLRPQSHSDLAAPTHLPVAAPPHLCPARLSGSSGGPLPSPLLWPRAARLLPIPATFLELSGERQAEGQVGLFVAGPVFRSGGLFLH